MHTILTSSISRVVLLSVALACNAAFAASDPAARQGQQVPRSLIEARDRVLGDLYRIVPRAREEVEKAAGYAVFDSTSSDAPTKGVLTEKAAGRTVPMTLERTRPASPSKQPTPSQVVVLKTPEAVAHFRKGVNTLPTGDAAASKKLMTAPQTDVVIYEITPDGLLERHSWGAAKYSPVRR